MARRVPERIRKGLSYRIRVVMNPWMKSSGGVWQHCHDVASRMDVRPWTVWSWYTGKSIPLVHNLFAFADEYEVSLDYLAGRTTARELRKGRAA